MDQPRPNADRHTVDGHDIVFDVHTSPEHGPLTVDGHPSGGDVLLAGATAAQTDSGQLERPRPQFGWILRNGESVEVHDAEDAVRLVLVGHPVTQGTEEVSQLDRPGGLDAREHSRHGRGW